MAGGEEEKGRPHRLHRAPGQRRQVVDIRGVDEANGDFEAFDYGVICDDPEEQALRAAHAETPQEVAGRAKPPPSP